MYEDTPTGKQAWIRYWLVNRQGVFGGNRMEAEFANWGTWFFRNVTRESWQMEGDRSSITAVSWMDSDRSAGGIELNPDWQLVLAAFSFLI